LAISKHDKAVLNHLILQLQDLALLEENKEKWNRWIKSNSIRPEDRCSRPPVCAAVGLFDEGFENGVLDPDPQCENPELHPIEQSLRQTLFRNKLMPDDMAIPSPSWTVPKIIEGYRDWGIQPQSHGARPHSGTSFVIESVIKTASDLDRLVIADLFYDEKKTMQQLEKTQDLVDKLMPVKLGGMGAAVQLMQSWTNMRGVEQTLYDMVENPELLHRGIQIIAEGYRRWYSQAEEMNLLASNDGEVYATDDLPKEHYNPGYPRLCDRMVFVEAQELESVSPRMHNNYALKYEKPLAEMFGLTSYGCCENLTDKIEDVAAIDNLRQIAVTPTADVFKCAERIGDRYIISWRP